MSKQRSFMLAIGIILIAAALQLIGLHAIPPGISGLEAYDVQIAELIRFGQVEVLYDMGSTGGREGLYHILLSAITAFVGNDPFGYRLLSVWMSLLTLSLMYTLARRLHGRFAGLMAMSVMAVPMGYILLSRMISREAMLPFIVLAGLTTLARALPIYRRPNLNPSTVPFAMLGFILALGFYVHPAHYPFVIAGMVFIGYMIITRQPMSRRTLSYLSFSLVILIVVATPYLITALRRPDLSGAARLGDLILTIQDTGTLRTVGNSLMGLFIRGDMSVLHNIPGRPFLDPLTGILMVWGIVIGVRRFMEPRYALPLLTLIVMLPVALFVENSPNFLGYMVILPLLAMFFGLGARALRRSTRYKRVAVVAVCVLLIGNVFVSVWSLSQWSQRADVQQAYHTRTYQLARYLDGTVSDTETVVCTSQVPVTNPVWLRNPQSDAALLALMMDNPDETQIRYLDCGTGIVFTNGGEHQQLIILQPDAINGFHPYVREWIQQGDLIQEGVPPQSVVSMIVDDQLGDTIGRFTTTAPAGFAPESPGGVGSALLPVNFEGNLTFLGYEQSDEDNIYAPGDIITVITYWRVDAPLPDSINLFAHMLFDAETLVTQTDTISVQPQRLDARDVFIQVTFVTLPDDLPDGTYQITVGAYEPNTDIRLAVLDNGQPRGTRLFLNEVQVVETGSQTADSGDGS